MLKFAIAGVLLSGVTSITHAYQGQTTQEVSIKTSDLNMADPSDRTKFSQRIIAACGDTSNVDPEGRNAVRACRDDANRKIFEQRPVELAGTE